MAKVAAGSSLSVCHLSEASPSPPSAAAAAAAGLLSIGDSLHTGNKPLRFPGIPSFSPEKFAYIQNPNPSKYKNFRVRTYKSYVTSP